MPLRTKTHRHRTSLNPVRLQVLADRLGVPGVHAQAEVVDVAPALPGRSAAGTPQLAVDRDQVDQAAPGAQLHQADLLVDAVHGTAEHLAALRLGDADALVRSFETGGHLRDGSGKVHPREDDRLLKFYVDTLQSERGANDWVPIVLATADDGRACAVEYSTEKLRGEETAPKEGLLVFERGDSGLFRSVRLYDELGLAGV